MSRTSRTSFVILAAVASIGFLAAASTDAFARGGSGGHGGGGHSMGGRSMGGHIASRSMGRTSSSRSFARVRHVEHHRPHYHWRFGWRRNYWITPLVSTGVATGVIATGPAGNRCTCLTKEYTQEGAVVFKDLCTKESAMNLPATSPAASLDPGPAASLQPLPQVR